MNALDGVIFDTRTHRKYKIRPERIKKCDKEHVKNWIIPMLPFQWHEKITEK